MERFIVAPEELDGNEAQINGDELRHLRTVLRLKTGDVVEVFDGAGRGYAGTLTDIDASRALVALKEPIVERRDSPLKIVLGQGIPKSDKMEWIAQKATELGVDSIIPLSLERCVARIDGDSKIKSRQARWRKVAIEAAKQCGRLMVPEVMAPIRLSDFIKKIEPSDLLLVPWEEGGKPLGEALRDTQGARVGAIFVLIGPEGGITRGEIQLCREAGGKVVTLGPRTLRTETAGLALLSALQFYWGDMG